MTTPAHGSSAQELQGLVDTVVHDAVAATATPRLDRLLVRASNAANYSRRWLVTAAALGVVGGDRGRQAARDGVLAIAVTSALTNLVRKPLARRQRPHEHPGSDSRRVRRPVSTSFPSGHAASAFAFASATVHYPSDVAVRAVIGNLCSVAVRRLSVHLAAHPRRGGDRDGERR